MTAWTTANNLDMQQQALPVVKFRPSRPCHTWHNSDLAVDAESGSNAYLALYTGFTIMLGLLPDKPQQHQPRYTHKRARLCSFGLLSLC